MRFAPSRGNNAAGSLGVATDCRGRPALGGLERAGQMAVIREPGLVRERGDRTVAVLELRLHPLDLATPLVLPRRELVALLERARERRRMKARDRRDLGQWQRSAEVRVDELPCALEPTGPEGRLTHRAVRGRRAHEPSDQREDQPFYGEVARLVAVVELPLELTGEGADHAVLNQRRAADEAPDPPVGEDWLERHVHDQQARPDPL